MTAYNADIRVRDSLSSIAGQIQDVAEGAEPVDPQVLRVFADSLLLAARVVSIYTTSGPSCLVADHPAQRPPLRLA